jgi:hypothetical protein
MAIIKTITYVRPNTTVDFPAFTDDVLTVVLGKRQSAIDSGKLTTNISLSDDELTKTMTFTMVDIDTLNQYINSVTLGQQSVSLAEFDLAKLQDLEVTRTDNLSGIDGTFTVTTVYTSPEGTPITTELDLSTEQLPSTYFGSTRNLQICIELHDEKVTNLSTTSNTLTVVHQYNDSTDFNLNCWKDSYIVVALDKLGISRNVQFALVDSGA